MTGMLSDMADAIRSLRRAPRFTVVLIAGMTAGVAASVTLYSVADALLFQAPAGIRAAEELVEVYTSRFTGSSYGPSSYLDFLDVRTAARSLSAVAAYAEGPFTTLRIAGLSRESEYAQVSDGFFETLGLEPHAGSLSFKHSAPARRKAVISCDLSSQVGPGGEVGQVLTLNGVDYVIVGVAPEGFRGLHLGSSPDVWIPLDTDVDRHARGRRALRMIGRVRDDASLEDAQAELSVLGRTLADRYPETNRGSQHAAEDPRRLSVVPYSRLEAAARPQAAVVAIILMAAIALALLSGCVNAGSLLLGRGLARRKELGIRLAVGASRGRLARLLVAESVVLALAGAAGGLLLSFWIGGALRSLLSPEEHALLSARPIWHTTVAVIVLAFGAGAIVGAVPAIAATRFSLAGSLQRQNSLGEATTAGLRLLVVAAQVLSATVLVAGAALLTRGLSYAAHANYLVAPERIALITIEGTASYQEAVLDRLRKTPGVSGAGSTTTLPLLRAPRREFRVRHEHQDASETIEAAINFASVGLFHALDVPVIAGRPLQFADDQPDERTVVVNEAFAHRYLGRTAVGRGFADSLGTNLQVVGVVRNEMYRAFQGPPQPLVYYPLSRGYAPRVHVVIRTPDDAGNHLPAYVDTATRNAGGRVVAATTFRSHLETALLQERIVTMLVYASGFSALSLTVLGVYAAATEEVRRRTREYALRLALGSTQWRLAGHLSGHTLMPVAVGAGLGIVTVGLALRLARSFAFFPYVTMATITTAAALVFGAAVLATAVPIWRAARMSPLDGLRN